MRLTTFSALLITLAALGAVSSPEAALAVPDPVVTTTSDFAGVVGSLRWAIDTANIHAGIETITFDIPNGGVHVITPATDLP